MGDFSNPTSAGTAEPTGVPRKRVKRSLITPRTNAVMAAIVAGVISGVIWGFARPGQNVQFIAPDQFGVAADSANASFMALVWYTGLAIVLGLITALISYKAASHVRSIAMQLWVGGAALIGAALIFVVGQVVAGFRQPDLTNLQDGATLSVIPAFDTYIALLVAPLIAMITYWVGLFVTDEDITVRESSIAPNNVK